MTASAAGTFEEPGHHLAQKAVLNREIPDIARARLMALISYELEESGGWFLEAPTRKLKPSQTCPACEHEHRKKLSEHTQSCERCNYTEPRGAASARIVYAWLLKELQAKDSGREPSCGRVSGLETAIERVAFSSR